MENPVEDIEQVVRGLCQTDPETQARIIDTYFSSNASFTHPFCRTGSFQNSRSLVHFIFRWYKIMSPTIELDIESVAFDAEKLLLYVTIHQVFRIWALPGHKSDVTLTTVLQLTHQTPSTLQYNPTRYYIRSQNDLYGPDQFIRFVLPWAGIGSFLVLTWQFFATLMCVLGCVVGWPVTWWEQRRADQAKDTSRSISSDLHELAQRASVNGDSGSIGTESDQNRFGDMAVVTPHVNGKDDRSRR